MKRYGWKKLLAGGAGWLLLLALCVSFLYSFGVQLRMEYRAVGTGQYRFEVPQTGAAYTGADTLTAQRDVLPDTASVLRLPLPRLAGDTLTLTTNQIYQLRIERVRYTVCGLPVFRCAGSEIGAYLARTDYAYDAEKNVFNAAADEESIVLRVPRMRILAGLLLCGAVLAALALLLLLQVGKRLAARGVSRRQAAFVGVFALLLAVPFCSRFAPSVQDNKNPEKRVLAQRPEFDVNRFASSAAAYETYFNDHLPFKNELVALRTSLLYNSFGISTSPLVLAGTDGWLFYRDTLPDFYGGAAYTQQQLAAAKQRLVRMQTLCKERNIPFYVMFTPNKLSVYGDEYLPKYAALRDTDAVRIEAAVDYLRTNTTIPVAYPREVLRQHRDDALLYYKQDTHWSELGAYLAYREWYETYAGETLPALAEAQLVDGTLQNDLAQMMNIAMQHEQYRAVDLQRGITVKLEYMDLQAGITRCSSTNQNGKKLLMVRDSFAKMLIPYLAQDFEESVFYRTLDMDALTGEMLDEEKPDVVIFELVERNFHLLCE
ncbi:MAG: hypothetical protein RSE54_00205 [Ruthenibacterium sp.]